MAKIEFTRGSKIITGALVNYIDNKFSSYHEPTRKGTPKGEAIGFSHVKYGATLLALTNIEVKKQANDLQVSYSMLRKWRTLDPFWEYVKKHSEEFALIFERKLKERTEMKNKLFKRWQNEIKNAQIDKVLNIKPPESSNLVEEFFGDIEIYGHHVTDSIWARFTKIFGMPLYSEKRSFPYIDFYFSIRVIEMDKKRIRKEFASLLLKRSIKILSRKKLAIEDRKNVLISLDMVDDMLKEG